jgi:dTDP-4-dehydrorhamnose reductase
MDDIDRLASLGISHVRYPVVWERIAPHGVQHADWSWTDERLERLRSAGIVPIVTLLHHGSGPRYTDLLDPQFPEKLAAFAGAVARRYPWLEYFTPVNEPVTTARFAALYGWWYPHKADEVSFYRALFNEIRGIAAAMCAIREELPQAKLVTTEDLGKTYATAHLQYQAEHENARRFLTYDLLCGVFERNAQMREHLAHLGLALTSRELARFVSPPDVLGFNYYVTGERWLDERCERYPNVPIGGNGKARYVDVEAVRVCAEGICGIQPLLREMRDRYGRALAITEAHLACTPDEQVRWLRDMHADATALRDSGIDVRAFTVWSLFGAFDWNSALTRQDGYYEAGAFDVSSAEPRETPIADYVRFLSGRSPSTYAPIEGEGWWSSLSRICYEPVVRDNPATIETLQAMRECRVRAIPYRADYQQEAEEA